MRGFNGWRPIQNGTNGKKAGATTQEKILALLRAQPASTGKELAAKIGISEDGVRYHLNRLKSSGRVRHVGPTKAGHWEVLK
jgi:ATP-dependent DNA helicase RecG